MFKKYSITYLQNENVFKLNSHFKKNGSKPFNLDSFTYTWGDLDCVLFLTSQSNK